MALRSAAGSAGRAAKRARINPYRVKIHLSYSVAEAADALGVHRNTVRNWITERGLPTVAGLHPYLILGEDLREFLIERCRRRKSPSGPGRIYCMRCRVPRRPARGEAEYRCGAGPVGNLVGVCPYCGCLMFRRANIAKLDEVADGLDVTITDACARIGEGEVPSVKSDIKTRGETHAKAPS